MSECRISAYQVVRVDDEWWQRLGQRSLQLCQQRLHQLSYRCRRYSRPLHLLRSDVVGLHAHLRESHLVGLLYLRMCYLVALVEDCRFAEDDVVRVYLIITCNLFGIREPHQVDDSCAVGDVCHNTFLASSRIELLEAENPAANLYEGHLARHLVDGVYLRPIHIFIRIILQEVAEGLDAQLLAEDILTSGTHPRKVFYVLV